MHIGANPFEVSVLPPGDSFTPAQAPLYVRSGAEDRLASIIESTRARIIFVVGVAGSGKSTLVDYVLRCHLARRSPSISARLVVSPFAARELSGPELDQQLFSKLREDIQRALSARNSAIAHRILHETGMSNGEWCHHALRLLATKDPNVPVSQVLLFFDGLDELPADAAYRLLGLTVEMTLDHAAQILITSRPAVLSLFQPRLAPMQDEIMTLDITGMEPVVQLYVDDKLPVALIEAVQTINAEIIRDLQKHPDRVHHLAPRRFEELIAEILASFGWDVQLTPETRDGGYDIFAISKDISGMRTSWIIECKRYREDRPVGVEIARSLYAVKGELRVSNAMIATTSSFTKGVREFTNSRYDFHLQDYEGLIDWINNYRPNPNGTLYLRDNRLILPRGPSSDTLWRGDSG